MEELQIAQQKLSRFVSEYEVFYGKCAMTMNVHCLTHLVDCVRSLGPLWAHSMFTFESFNGTLKKYGESSNYVINQVLEKIILSASENICNANTTNAAVCANKIVLKLSNTDAIVFRRSKISLLIVVGDHHTLHSNDRNWKYFIDYMCNNDGLIGANGKKLYARIGAP